MTRAPENLLAVRNLLLAHLNVDKNTVRSEDLEPGEVGIVGDASHLGGYHCGSDRVVPNDYSVVESTRDSSGLTLDASALDVGMFTVKSGGATHDLRSFSTWCVAQCVANTAGTRDIREIIYSPDGKTVKRWDRLKKRTTGDSSHLIHTHFSFFRDSTKAGRDQTPLFRRYLTTIGLLEDVDMTPDQANQLAELYETITRWRVGFPTMADGKRGIEPVKWRQRDEVWQATVSANLAKLLGKDWVDEPAIVQGVLAGLTPEKIAAAIPPQLAKDVADELARRLAS
ncbi:hypothetical protein GA0074695_2147 [Micromonospora viridifaciens]|uniref:Uncharacterized protein n=1 Tax=Micromonospora viridifaciens TaxID=1881 RepID=A0A1C4W737_MICVI|nr:hypothetical protein [Micromonospora viridifaciens]SCE91984.1 hypothetical protein GA0074695_2147 [Micromonospora viridifaciens]